MKLKIIREILFPSGPIFGLTLIGILLLSAILYYRAVNIQRFLEPALAISQPRNQFSEDINRLLTKEFDANEVKGVRFMMGSILIDESLLFPAGSGTEKPEQEILERLSRVFLSAMDDNYMRSHVSLVLVSVRFPVSETGVNGKSRLTTQHRAEAILDYMYRLQPSLEKEYGSYFAATAMPVYPSERDPHMVEFRIIPSELLHIEMLQRLGKYAH